MGHGARPERQQIFTWVKSDKMSAICDRLGWISPCQLCETLEKKLHPKEDLMPGYNTQFELSVEDLDLIETALMRNKLALTQDSLKKRPNTAPEGDDVRQIHELLGRLHNQKAFYRPRAGAYISG